MSKEGTKRATFKRAELHQLGKLLEASTTGDDATRTWREGRSDATVATEISAKLGKPVTDGDVRRVRHQVLGKFPGEGRPSTALLESLTRTIHNQGLEIAALRRRVTTLEELPPEPAPLREAVVIPNRPHGNGYHPPRGGR